MWYQCDQCDYKAIQEGELKKHKVLLHGGVKYSCDQCDYKTREKSSVNRHMLVIHEGVRYRCAFSHIFYGNGGGAQFTHMFDKCL